MMPDFVLDQLVLAETQAAQRMVVARKPPAMLPSLLPRMDSIVLFVLPQHVLVVFMRGALARLLFPPAEVRADVGLIGNKLAPGRRPALFTRALSSSKHGDSCIVCWHRVLATL